MWEWNGYRNVNIYILINHAIPVIKLRGKELINKVSNKL